MSKVSDSPVRIGRGKDGSWDYDMAFSAERDFFQSRGILNEDDLKKVIGMIPGTSGEVAKEILCTFGFSVNFLSQRVTGYALRVDKYASASNFYYPKQKVTFVVVIVESNTKRNPSTLQTQMKDLVETMGEDNMWKLDPPEENETRNETDRRVFFDIVRRGREEDLYLYVKGSMVDTTTNPSNTVERHTLATRERLNGLKEKAIPMVMDSFFGDEEDSNAQVRYHALTNTFVQEGDDYYFLSDCIFLDYMEDTILIFDNFEKKLKVYREIKESDSNLDFASMFKYPPLAPAMRKNTRLVVLESPIANARLDKYTGEPFDIYHKGIVEHMPPMEEMDENFHKTIVYKKMFSNDMNPSLRTIEPMKVVYQQGPVYRTTKTTQLSFRDTLDMAVRVGDDFIGIPNRMWENLMGAMRSLEKAELPITSMHMSKTEAYFPTSVLSAHYTHE